MKFLQFKKRILISIVALVSVWAGPVSAEIFNTGGVITSVGYDLFTMHGKKYRFAPGAEIVSNDNSRRKFSDFKPSDFITFKGQVINGVRYVNIIYYKPLGNS